MQQSELTVLLLGDKVYASRDREKLEAFVLENIDRAEFWPLHNKSGRYSVVKDGMDNVGVFRHYPGPVEAKEVYVFVITEVYEDDVPSILVLQAQSSAMAIAEARQQCYRTVPIT